MMRKWLAGTALGATLLVASGAGAADGTLFDRFRQWVDTNPLPDSWVYDSVKPLGEDGLVLDGLVRDRPGLPVRTIDRVVVRSLDFDAIEASTPPLHADIKVSGMRGSPDILNESLGGGDVLGLDTLTVDWALNYRLDESAGTLTVSPLTVVLRDRGAAEVAFVLARIHPVSTGEPVPIVVTATLDSASIRYVDDSLLSRVVAAWAADQGQTVGARVEQMIVELTERVRAGGGSTAGEDLLAGLSLFLRDHERPEPLVVTAVPPAPIRPLDAVGADSLDQTLDLLGVKVAYGD